MDVDEDEYILDAVENAGIEVNYDCRMGVCMMCPAKLVSGPFFRAVPLRARVTTAADATTFFSLSLSDHDGDFSPRARWTSPRA